MRKRWIPLALLLAMAPVSLPLAALAQNWNPKDRQYSRRADFQALSPECRQKCGEAFRAYDQADQLAAELGVLVAELEAKVAKATAAVGGVAGAGGSSA